MRYAEILQSRAGTFPRVRIERDYENLTGHYAWRGAVGRVVYFDRGVRSVLFERDSHHLVKPNCLGQCMLTGIPQYYLTFLGG